MTKYLLIIKADEKRVFDADYLHSTQLFEEHEVDALRAMLTRVFEAMDKKHPDGRHNWPSGDYADSTPELLYSDVLSEHDLDWFSELVPYGEMGVHSIDSCQLITVENIEEFSSNA